MEKYLVVEYIIRRYTYEVDAESADDAYERYIIDGVLIDNSVVEDVPESGYEVMKETDPH